MDSDTAPRHDSFGTRLLPDGRVRFRLFAPTSASVRLALQGRAEPISMEPDGHGWFEVATPEASAGSLYRFLLPDGTSVADPGSRFQPQDVHGPSEVIDPAAYPWQDQAWRSRPWTEAILYELHVGTFTPEGTFPAARQRLDHLARLGITAIELMCLSDFAGNRNWGYDGVLLSAPDSAYGRPEEMKAFIDAAHARGIMVLLDVVYNHFGPEGNDLPLYFPQLLSDKHTTPWGQSLNFDGDHSQEVRELVLQNAVYWVEEFHIDGLRLDASHAMIDESPRHILDELRERTRAAAGDRPFHLILESEQNDASRLARGPNGEIPGYTAQWNHDITHLLGAAVSNFCGDQGWEAGETEKLAQAIAEGFVIAVEEKHECPKIPPTAYTAFIQTHDLVGNRIFGDRLASLAPVQAIRAIAAVYLLGPQVPMLFMGEEWNATEPFPFFSDYHGDLAEAVRKGRCDQLSKLNPAPSPDELSRAPDPQAESTLRSAQLQWSDLNQPEAAAHLDFYTRLLQVRRDRIVPLLAIIAETCGTHRVVSAGAIEVTWNLPHGQHLHLAANLCAEPHGAFTPPQGELIWLEGNQPADDQLDPWSVRWTLEA